VLPGSNVYPSIPRCSSCVGDEPSKLTGLQPAQLRRTLALRKSLQGLRPI
jgi:hypothetical protein